MLIQKVHFSSQTIDITDIIGLLPRLLIQKHGHFTQWHGLRHLWVALPIADASPSTRSTRGPPPYILYLPLQLRQLPFEFPIIAHVLFNRPFSILSP